MSRDIFILLFEKSHVGGPVHLYKINLVSPNNKHYLKVPQLKHLVKIIIIITLYARDDTLTKIYFIHNVKKQDTRKRKLNFVLNKIYVKKSHIFYVWDGLDYICSVRFLSFFSLTQLRSCCLAGVLQKMFRYKFRKRIFSTGFLQNNGIHCSCCYHLSCHY